MRNEAFPPVCGTAHPSGLRDRGADDGVHAQHDPRISAIMQSSLRVIPSWSGYGLARSASVPPGQAQVSQLDDYLSSSWPLWSGMVGVSPVTGKADELGSQAVPSSMLGETWT